MAISLASLRRGGDARPPRLLTYPKQLCLLGHPRCSRNARRVEYIRAQTTTGVFTDSATTPHLCHIQLY
jgi:hypothetical protein